MALKLFFSYSHVDEALRDQLEVHLVTLQRQGLISTWHDRRIIAGSEVEESIDTNLESAEIILLLVSPNFIASDYCYRREMLRAMERHRAGEARVIPIILRHCDWQRLPFGRLLAAPRDGKPISSWTDADEAFLDVERAIRSAVEAIVPKPRREVAAGEMDEGLMVKASNHNPESATEHHLRAVAEPRSSNLRLRREFTDLDKDRFRQEAFEYISKFFENSMQELVERNPDAGLEQRFRRLDAETFTAAVYQQGQKVCMGAASMRSDWSRSHSINYVMKDSYDGGMNESVLVEADDQKLFLSPLGMNVGVRNDKLSMQGAAEIFWALFIRPLQ